MYHPLRSAHGIGYEAPDVILGEGGAVHARGGSPGGRRVVPLLARRCALLCCAVLCCAVLCCDVLCCGVLCCAVLCCSVMCFAVVWCGVLCCAVMCPVLC